MSENKGQPRRNGDKDLSKVVNILEKLPFEDFMELFKLFESYHDKTSSLRITRLLYDALAISRIRHLDAIAPILEKKADWAKSAKSISET